MFKTANKKYGEDIHAMAADLGLDDEDVKVILFDFMEDQGFQLLEESTRKIRNGFEIALVVKNRAKTERPD